MVTHGTHRRGPPIDSTATGLTVHVPQQPAPTAQPVGATGSARVAAKLGALQQGERSSASADVFAEPEPADADPTRRKVTRWFARREADARREIRADDLLEVQQHIREVHDGKWRGLPDPRASVQYARLGEQFLTAAGVSKAEQSRAMRYAAASGLWYALAQIPVFPSRLIPGMTPALEGLAMNGAMLGRTGYHIGISALMAPLFSTLADLSKQGQPVPGAWWNTGTRRDVAHQLQETLKLGQATLDACKEAGCAVPEGVVEMLEAARRLYKHRNAHDFVLASAGFASGAFEFVKTAADIVVAGLTAGVGTPLARPALNALTSLVYIGAGPAEEAAAMRTLCTQNAKYADILDAGGHVDEAKVKALWMTRTQVESAYVEKALRRHMVRHLHEIQDARDKLGLLQELARAPAGQGERVTRELARTRAEIAWVKERIEALKPHIGKRDRWDAEYIGALREGGAPEPLVQQMESLFADALERDAQRRAGSASEPAEAVSAVDAFVGFLQRACNGRQLMEGLQKQLGRLQQEEAEQVQQLALAQSAKQGRAPAARARADRLSQQVARQERRLREQEQALADLVHDWRAFQQADAAALSPQGLVYRMLGSKATLYKEAIAAKYGEPGVLQAALGERLPVAADVALWLNLAVEGQLQWHGPVHVTAADPGQRDVLGNLVMTGTLGAAIEQTVNASAQRCAVADKVAMPPPFAMDLQQALVEVAGWTKAEAAEVPPLDLGDYARKYGLAPRQPDRGSGRLARMEENAAQFVRRVAHTVRDTVGTPFSAVRAKVTHAHIKTLSRDIHGYNQAHAAAQAAAEEPEVVNIRL